MIMFEVMTSRLPQVCKLWLGVGMGMFPERHPHGCHLPWGHLARRFNAPPTYHKEEGATPYPGVCKFSLQYYRRPDVRFGVRVGRVIWVDSVEREEKFVKN